jgi:hypothetical protein
MPEDGKTFLHGFETGLTACGDLGHRVMSVDHVHDAEKVAMKFGLRRGIDVDAVA